MITTAAGPAAQQQAWAANLSARQSIAPQPGSGGVVSERATGGAAGLRCRSLAVMNTASRAHATTGRGLKPAPQCHKTPELPARLCPASGPPGPPLGLPDGPGRGEPPGSSGVSRTVTVTQRARRRQSPKSLPGSRPSRPAWPAILDARMAHVTPQPGQAARHRLPGDLRRPLPPRDKLRYRGWLAVTTCIQGSFAICRATPVRIQTKPRDLCTSCPFSGIAASP